MATQLTMPRLSQDMETGIIVEWLKREGDPVERGQVLLVVETDKASVDVEAPEDGLLLRILVPEGSEVPIGAPLAVIGAAGESADATPPVAGDAPPQAPAATSIVEPPTATTARPAERQPASPAARRVARELGVDLARVTGTGPGGLVGEGDVRAYAGRADAPDAPEADAADGPEDVEVVALGPMRRRIAERMALSRRTAADVTTVIDVSMDAVARLRSETRLSYTTYVVWAVAQTLPQFPDINATFVDDAIRRHRRVDLGVAVAVDGGLVVPVVRDAASRSPGDLEAEVARLAELARAGTIQPADMAGASFTVTNSGAFGSLLFTPIINVPQVAILGIGRVADVPVVRGDKVVPGKVMYLSLSYDHRVVDGATAVRFLSAVKERLQDVEAGSPR
ncbi:MAG TPA: dihydrolipoamide acetyltransferase family protein [Candidatus Limnocylindrales bacterium]|nr:dihydrolipoamide acetyltransferase family protein [Candidatus Limnocylindrales bacterium]